jgi:signal transduction histidine kinase
MQTPAETPLTAGLPRMRPYLWLALVALGPLALLLLRFAPAANQISFYSPLSHILISADASLLCAALAVLLLRVAYRAQDGRIFLVGMGFLSTASMLIVSYRLSTADGCCDTMISWPPLLSLCVGGFFFCLSGLDLSVRTNRWLMRRAGIGLIAYLCVWLVYSWFFLLPSQSSQALEATSNTALSNAVFVALGIGGLGCYVFAIRRHYRLYRRAPSPAGLAITCGILLFGEALFTALQAQPYSLAFWLYHIEVATGFTVISYAILRTYHHGQSDESLLERVFLAGTRSRLQVENALALDALIITLACAEQPTPALRRTLQRRFGLMESQLEVLEQASAAVAQERRQHNELQRLNTALQQLEQDKELLVQMLVHDLKNPLAAQSGCIEVLQQQTLTQYQYQLLEQIQRSGKILGDLIDNLLDIARLEQGRLEIQRSLVPPRDLLETCVGELQSLMSEEQKHCLIETANDLPLLNIDLQLMRRVISNLISNAIKHTPAGTTILLRSYLAPSSDVQRGAPRLVVEVADTGPGIETEFLDHIFEKFERASKNQPERYRNTGLGLTFCRLATEAQGGTIGVTSRVGHGTTFRLELPAR